MFEVMKILFRSSLLKTWTLWISCPFKTCAICPCNLFLVMLVSQNICIGHLLTTNLNHTQTNGQTKLNATGIGIDRSSEEVSIPLEQHLMNELDMVYTRRKHGCKGPILILHDCKRAMDKLVAHRHVGGITEDNVYCFACPGCQNSLQTLDSL